MTQEVEESKNSQKTPPSTQKSSKSKAIKRSKPKSYGAPSIGVSQGSTLENTNSQGQTSDLNDRASVSKKVKKLVRLTPFNECSATLQSQQNAKVLLSLLRKHPASRLLEAPLVPTDTNLSLSELQGYLGEAQRQSKLELYALKPIMNRMFDRAAQGASNAHRETMRIMAEHRQAFIERQKVNVYAQLLTLDPA